MGSVVAQASTAGSTASGGESLADLQQRQRELEEEYETLKRANRDTLAQLHRYAPTHTVMDEDEG